MIKGSKDRNQGREYAQPAEEMRIREETNERRWSLTKNLFVSVKLGGGISQLIIMFLPPQIGASYTDSNENGTSSPLQYCHLANLVCLSPSLEGASLAEGSSCLLHFSQHAP